MNTARRLPILAAGLLIAGCATDPRDSPTHLRPGNSIDVAQQALGRGGAAGGYQEGATIGSVPLIDYRAPNIPVMQDGVVDYLFAFSVESADGEAERDEHWVKVKVQEQSFTKAHRNNQKSLLNDAQVSEIQRQDMVPNSARLRQRTDTDTQAPLPIVRTGGQPTTRVTVAELDPAGGAPRVVGSATVPTAGSTAPGSTQPSNQDVERMLNYFNSQQAQRVQAAQPQPAPGAAGTSTVGGGN
jgi:hypothetical protein